MPRTCYLLTRLHFDFNILRRLHLVDNVGKISLAEVALTEDPGDEERPDEGT